MIKIHITRFIIKLENNGVILPKEFNIIPEVILIWPAVRYTSGTSQYWCIISSLLLFYIFNIYIYIYIIFIFKILIIW